MTKAVRVESAARGYQLTAYPTVGTSKVQPWVADTNGARTPVTGVMLQLPLAAVAAGNTSSTWIEYGGPDVTAGNGLVLIPGDSALVNAPNAAAIWIVPSASGMQVRAQVQ